MGNPFVSALAPIVLVFMLALVVESVIEYLGVPLPSVAKPYVAAMFAVLVCVAYDADILAIMGYRARVPYVGAVLTGLMAGRGSSFVNSFWKRIQVIQMPATTVDEVAEGWEIQQRLDRYVGPKQRSKI